MAQIQIIDYFKSRLTDLIGKKELLAIADYSHMRKGLLTGAIQLPGAYLEFVFGNDELIYDMIHVSSAEQFCPRRLFEFGMDDFRWEFAVAEAEEFFMRHALETRNIDSSYLMDDEMRLLVEKREVSFIEGRLSTIDWARRSNS